MKLHTLVFCIFYAGSACAQTVDQTKPAWEYTMDALQNAQSRPIFSPDRKPAAPPVATTNKILAPPSPEPQTLLSPLASAEPQIDEPLVLLGTVTGPTPVALLKMPNSEVPVRVMKGASAKGWTLISVKSGIVTLQNSGDKRYLNLKINRESTQVIVKP